MLSTDILHNEIVWSRLQEPIHTTKLPQDYLLLLAALDNGWKIYGPARLVYIDRLANDCSYLFNLTHDRLSRTVHLAVPASRIIEQFLCEEGITVLFQDTPALFQTTGLIC
jgi:hypothetical protein